MPCHDQLNHDGLCPGGHSQSWHGPSSARANAVLQSTSMIPSTCTGTLAVVHHQYGVMVLIPDQLLLAAETQRQCYVFA